MSISIGILFRKFRVHCCKSRADQICGQAWHVNRVHSQLSPQLLFCGITLELNIDGGGDGECVLDDAQVSTNGGKYGAGSGSSAQGVGAPGLVVVSFTLER